MPGTIILFGLAHVSYPARVLRRRGAGSSGAGERATAAERSPSVVRAAQVGQRTAMGVTVASRVGRMARQRSQRSHPRRVRMRRPLFPLLVWPGGAPRRPTLTDSTREGAWSMRDAARRGGNAPAVARPAAMVWRGQRSDRCARGTSAPGRRSPGHRLRGKRGRGRGGGGCAAPSGSAGGAPPPPRSRSA